MNLQTPKIIFEDSELLVLDKPAGLVVHEGIGQNDHTLLEFLQTYLKNSPLEAERWGILHRLDKDTSGIMLVAKTKAAFDFYKHLFQIRAIAKEYLALIHGPIKPREGVIQVPLSRSLTSRIKFEPARHGRLAETRYEVIEYKKKFSYIKAYPRTGRTHQIRVHFSVLGHPIVGDKVYGRRPIGVDIRQFLHAHRISFIDRSGAERMFVSPLPADLQEFLDGIQ